ncbi:MAG: nucleotidyltransferase domain-containing protein [Pseudobutyrivibrio sp.]|nr:nucleotidyltransferase domain-containing protein [Pseudobutyrivibrio sp.]
MVDSLKEIRKSIGYTQSQAADYLKVSLRSYKSYENDPQKSNSIKYLYLIETLGKLNTIDETHGILDIEAIKEKCEKVFKDYKIEYCYLFGSYAKGKAKEDSDIDLLISSTVKGLKFYGLVEKLSNTLHKKIDLLDKDQLVANPELLDEVLKDGIKIYG